MGDYIKRQDVLDAYNKEQMKGYGTWSFRAIVNSVPSANVREDVQGEWKPGKDIFDDSTWYCSVCGEPWTLNAGTPA